MPISARRVEFRERERFRACASRLKKCGAVHSDAKEYLQPLRDLRGSASNLIHASIESCAVVSRMPMARCNGTACIQVLERIGWREANPMAKGMSTPHRQQDHVVNERIGLPMAAS